ncbi:MAG: hypothetical protein ABS45_10225 [Comamonas sp. SCN 65-56]|nr:MAG: hypothetical protein ABS45_10225 [Comamonas sp. SCN 65-56]
MVVDLPHQPGSLLHHLQTDALDRTRKIRGPRVLLGMAPATPDRPEAQLRFVMTTVPSASAARAASAGSYSPLNGRN